jgi:hypothetical protein
MVPRVLASRFPVTWPTGRMLTVVCAHAAIGAALWAMLGQQDRSALEVGAGFAVAAGTLTALLWLAGQLRGPLSTLLRPVPGPAVVVVALVLAWVGNAANDSHDIIIGLLGLLFSGVMAALLLARHLRRPGLSTGDVVCDAAVATWTAYCILELVWHISAGGYYTGVDVNAFVGAMATEAEVMLLGPAAIGIGALIAGWLLGSVLVWLGLRRGTSRPRPVGALILVLSGGLALVALPRSARLAALHHVHPTVHDLAAMAGGPMDTDTRSAETLDLRLPESIPVAAWLDAPRHPARARNVVLMFIDTLPRRHLDAYGYPRPVAPNIAKLAARSTRFTQARSNSGHTDIATATVFYSLLPVLAEGRAETYARGHGGVPVHLLAQAAGWKAGIFSADWETAGHGFGPLYPARCDAFSDARGADADLVTQWAGRPEDEVVDEFLDWYPTVLASGQPFFGYVKMLRPHMPYYVPPEGRGDWQPPWPIVDNNYGLLDLRPNAERHQVLTDRYDNAIHFVDAQLGRVMDDLEARGVADETAIVLVSDHGEGWGEHGMYMHGMAHYEEMVEVPLLVYVPGEPPATDDRRVATMDVAPTLLDVLGLPAYGGHQGTSLLETGPSRRWHVTVSNTSRQIATLWLDDWKYTMDMDTGEHELIHLGRDPAETTDLSETELAVVAEMRGVLVGTASRQLDAMETFHLQGVEELLQ